MAKMTLTTVIPEHLEARLKSCRSLPSVPAVAMRIIDLCEQDDVGVSEIASVLARDPALAAKLLRTANSALYSLRSQVTTLDRAVSILGTNATLSLCLSFSLVETVRRSHSAGFNYLIYWRRSIITAATAEALSSSNHRSDHDECFLAGLLQDIGMLVLNEIEHDAYGRIVLAAKGNHQKIAELEIEQFGTDHATIGGWLLDNWKLPEILRFSVATSHSVPDGCPSDMPLLCRETAFAGHVAEIWTNPRTAAATALARQKALDLMQMPPERFEWLLGQVAASLPEITSNLDLKIGSAEALNRIFNQAREELVGLNMKAQEQVRLAQQRAKQDALTGLHNRSHLEDLLPQYFEEASRTGRPLSAIFVDIDHFKKINDAYGHQAGDIAIRSVAGILQSAIRSEDLLARYGGEEFVCLLINANASEAVMVAERMRKAVSSALLRISEGAEIAVRISLGCATLSDSRCFPNADSLLHEADRCLYDAKQSGRNRVVSSSIVPASPACSLPEDMASQQRGA
jgi:diguanylate cyclase (GGDEF)-like protein